MNRQRRESGAARGARRWWGPLVSRLFFYKALEAILRDHSGLASSEVTRFREGGGEFFFWNVYIFLGFFIVLAFVHLKLKMKLNFILD